MIVVLKFGHGDMLADVSDTVGRVIKIAKLNKGGWGHVVFTWDGFELDAEGRRVYR